MGWMDGQMEGPCATVGRPLRLWPVHRIEELPRARRLVLSPSRDNHRRTQCPACNQSINHPSKQSTMPLSTPAVSSSRNPRFSPLPSPAVFACSFPHSCTKQRTPAESERPEWSTAHHHYCC